MICGKVSQRESFRSSAMQAGHTWKVNDEERSFACRCALPYKRASSARYVVATMCDTGTERTCASISRSITVGTMVLSSFMADCLLPGRKTYPRVVPLPQKFLSSQRSRTPAIHSFGNGVNACVIVRRNKFDPPLFSPFSYSQLTTSKVHAHVCSATEQMD